MNRIHIDIVAVTLCFLRREMARGAYKSRSDRRTEINGLSPPSLAL
jgi:hypothetical protein